GLLSVYLRRWLHETPVFAELQLRQSLAAELPLKAVLREHRPAVLLSMLLTWVLSAGIVVVILMTPTLLQTQHGFAAGEALAANSLAIVGLTFGCVLAGLSADRFGAGPTFVCGGLLLLASSSAFYASLAEHRDLLLPLYALAGLCVGTIGAIPMVMVKAFPAVVRFSGLSFSYNLAYAICGGLTPILVSLLLKWSPLGPAYYVGALCLLLVLAGAALWRRTALAPAPAA
ncbi:MFS transporter, partial [Azotobacter chroococcum]|nr:MFS transporter [Azotobacter chroococcum]